VILAERRRVSCWHESWEMVFPPTSDFLRSRFVTSKNQTKERILPPERLALDTKQLLLYFESIALVP
jgi:hypothetical protein